MDMIATTFDIAMFLSMGGDCVSGDRALTSRIIRPTPELSRRAHNAETA
jgi:hypothetical protein